MTEMVVINASPLILLSKIGRADLLTELFDEVVVPNAVWREIVAGGETESTAPLWSALNRLTQVTIAEISPEVENWNLGDGESEVLTLALMDRRYRAVVDDRAARICATALGVRVLGTGGLLILAKRNGLIKSVGTELRRLLDRGLWLSTDTMKLLLDQAGEGD
jgi:predicted nucleic acid-binding protein